MKIRMCIIGLALTLSATLANAEWHRIALGGLKTEVDRAGQPHYYVILEPAAWMTSPLFTIRNITTSTDVNVERVMLLPPSEHVQVWLAMVMNASAQGKAILADGFKQGGTLMCTRLAMEN